MASHRKTSVLITGCTPGGIGHALCLEFHNRGCHVIATARRPEVLKELQDVGISAVALDVTDQKSIAACKAEVEQLTGGKLDILINNAGRSHTIPATDVVIDDVRQTYETNVFGPMAMCAAFVSLLVPARGLIVNISSLSSMVPYLFASVYSSTKGAINVYSRALRMELKPFGVRVMVAMTGTVKSNFTSHEERTLPPTSLYMPVNDRFLDRIHFSQKTATLPTHVYAKNIADQALKGEGWLWGWFGRTPDWYWTGGLSLVVWIQSCMPNWMSEKTTAIFFRMGQMKKQLDAARKTA